MFNFIAQMTNQGVQLLGMMTEAIHTPHIVDRAIAVENARYVFNATRDFANEFNLKSDGFINTRAIEVLDQAIEFLAGVEQTGLFEAMAQGHFADIKRTEDGGKGLDGVFKKDENYINPFMDKMKLSLNID